MTHFTTAVFEKGAFRPIKPIQGIPEHATVRISVETIIAPSKSEQLALLAAVPVAEELAEAIDEGRNRSWPVNEF